MTKTKKNEWFSSHSENTTFTQLLRIENGFGNQNEKFSYHLAKYSFIAELFTNVKLREKQIPDYIKLLSSTFRKIINADVRYKQRMDDLPCAVGCRAFGVAPLGGGWYSPNIKVACSSAKVLEYICRQWCKRSSQYPHTLVVQFDNCSNANRAMPSQPDKYSRFYEGSNRHIRREGCILTEEYYLSMPFRLELYTMYKGFMALQFGSACRIIKTDYCHFDNLNNMAVNIKQSPFIINDCFEVNGTRAVQPWGHYGNKKTLVNNLPSLQKTRKFYGGNTDKMASLYYRACRAGFVTFNAYVYGRMKAGINFYEPLERNPRPQFERLTKKENEIMRKTDYCAHPEELKKWAEECKKRQKCKPKALR